MKVVVSIGRSGQGFSVICCFPFRELTLYQQEHYDSLITAELGKYCKKNNYASIHSFMHSMLVNMYQWTAVDLKNCLPIYVNSSMYGQKWVLTSNCWKLRDIQLTGSPSQLIYLSICRKDWSHSRFLVYGIMLSHLHFFKQ